MEDYLSKSLGFENLSRHIIEVLPYFICITDAFANVVYINKNGRAALHENNASSVKNVYDFIKISDFLDKDGKKITVEDFPLYKSLNDNKEVKNFILKFENDNKDCYFIVSSFPLLKNDKMVGAVMILGNSTEDYLLSVKVKNEREKFLELSTELNTKCNIIEILRDREKEHLMHLKDVMNNISEGIVVLDANEKISLCNKAVSRILNLTALELVNKVKMFEKYFICLEYDEEENQDNAKRIFENCIKNKKTMKNIIFKFIDKSSFKEKYIELNSNPIIKSNELVYTILTIKDITEKKVHQIYAQKQAEFVKNVVDTVEVPIAVVEYPKMEYKLTNKKYEQIISNQSDANKVLIFDSEKPRYINYDLYAILKNVINNYQKYTIKPYSIKDEKGNDRFYKIKFVPYRNKDNSTSIYIHGSDITEEINHNIELEKITKLKDEFFTVISHELRTPLTIIYSSLQLAYDVYQDEITPNMEKTLFRINQNCSRLLKLTNNILDISKAEAGFLTLNNLDFDIVYVSEAVVNSANAYAVSKGIELIFDTDREECSVRLDKDKYEKILLNLLSNAIKFTPEGKKIIVSLSIENEFFYLSVKDFGIGIPDDKINYIFDRFAQINSSLSRRAEGTGIGLALVKKLLELMNGEIEVKSKLGEGTEFIVKFKRINSETGTMKNNAILTENIKDRINIEFSDIN